MIFDILIVCSRLLYFRNLDLLNEVKFVCQVDGLMSKFLKKQLECTTSTDNVWKCLVCLLF